MRKLTKAQLSKKYQVSARTLYSYEQAGVDLQDAQAVDAHRAGLRSQPAPSGTELQRLKAEGLRLANEKAARILQAFDGEYLLRAAVEARESRIGRVISALIRAIATELPPILAGLDEAALEVRLKEWRQGWVEKITDEQSALWVEAKRATIASLKGDLRKAAEQSLAQSDKSPQ